MAVVGGEETSLEYTPTWVVALVFLSIVSISLAAERFFHRTGQLLKKLNSWPLIGASTKIKDELMLLGFISLLLAVFQTRIGKICLSEQLNNRWLPCKKPNSSSTVANFTTSSFPSSGTQGRRLLAMASDTADYCSQKGKVPLLSVEAIHHLHIFIFVLATFHVVLCVLKVVSMINQWSLLEKHEESIQIVDEQKRVLTKFLEDCNNGLNLVRYMLMSRRQKSDASITKLEYIALRLNFIVASDPKDLGKDFRDKDLGKNLRDYIMTTLEKDFEEMIGISWRLWLIAVIYLLVNVAVDSLRGEVINILTKSRWNAYFWICLIPFTILVIITIKLEFMIMQLVKEIAKRHTQEGKESSENGAKTTFFEIPHSHFRLGGSHLVGNLIHVVLFVNSLELAFFFFILFQYGFHSCIMGKVGFVVPRIVIGVFVQLICIYRTIPLYAILKSQMHLKEQQSDKQKERYPAHKEKKRRCPDIEEIKMLLKKNQSDEHIKECLDSLEEIEMQLKRNERDEEEEMWIVTWISKWIDKGKKPSLTEGAKSIEMTGMGSKEGTVGDEITQADDIEAQIGNMPAPT